MLIFEQQKYQANASRANHPHHSDITATFSVLVSLYHALELLERQGLYSFINFFNDTQNSTDLKYFVGKDPELKQFLVGIKQEFITKIPLDFNETSPDGSLVVNAVKLEDFQLIHPKFSIVSEKLAKFFIENPDSKVS